MSEKNGKISEYLAKLQARAWFSRALYVPGQHMLKDEESVQDNHVFACNFYQIFTDFKFFSLSD